MTDRTKDIIGTTVTRDATFNRAAVDEVARTVEIAFSSDAPVDRWYGKEILSHEPGAVRLQRLNDGGPLLLGHDPERQIGVNQNSRIEGGKTGRSTVRFSKGDLGEEIFQDVLDEIRTKISVGYHVHDMVLKESGDDGDVYLVTDWEPLETSFASIPADSSVGVGRAHTNKPENIMPDKIKTDQVDPTDAPTDNEPTNNAADRDHSPAPVPSVVDYSNPYTDTIRAVANFFDLVDFGEREILLGSTLDEFRAKVRSQRPDPVPSVPRIEARIPRAGKLKAFRAELYGSQRDAEEQAYRAGQWARATIFGDQDAARWCRDYGVQIEKRVLTGAGSGQQAIIPDELALPIISLREKYGVARRYCDVHPMVSDTATVPRDSSEVTAYFVGREEAPTANDPGFDNVELVAKNVAAEVRLSNDYAEDSAINLADYVARKQGRAFFIKEDNCLFNGDGTSTYGGINGIRTRILGLAGAVEAAAPHNLFSEIDAPDLRLLMGSLQDVEGIEPMWFASKAGGSATFGRLKDAAGGNTKQNLSEGEADTYGGYDIVTSPAMPTSLASLDALAMLVFGDLMMGVKFGDRRGLTMIVDPYSLSSYQQTKIISSERFDINCHGVGDATYTGPVVALIGNAA